MPHHSSVKQTACKVLILFFFLSFIFLSHCIAQEVTSKHKFFLGIKGGLGYSHIKGAEVDLYRNGGDDIKPLVGVIFGILGKYGFSDDIYGKLEAFHSVKGGKYNGSTFYEHQNKVVTYLEFPLLVGYNLISSPGLKIGVEAGPAFHYVIGPYKYDKNNYQNPASIRTPNTMLSAVAGLDLRFYNPVMDFFLNLRYDFDNKEFFYREYIATHYYMKHAGTVSLSAGIFMRLSKK